MSEPRSFLGGRVVLHAGDCRDVLRGMADNSIDSVVCDPPYHLTSIVKRFAKANPDDVERNFVNRKIDGQGGSPFSRSARGFMGKQWDGGDIAFQPELWAEVLRVLKPGGYIMAFSGCRTYHRMACAIEDAGFITHPFFAFAFGSGFPKAHSVSKQIDKRGGKSINWFGPWLRKWREEKGVTQKQIAALFPSKIGGLTGCVANWELGLNLPTNEQFNLICETFKFPFENMKEAEREVIGRGKACFSKGTAWSNSLAYDYDITAPATDAAREWDGWFYGTQACKPALEPVYFGQKPFERGLNGAQNVLKWGVGAINVAACRIPISENDPESYMRGERAIHMKRGADESNSVSMPPMDISRSPLGRWPANLITDGSDDVLACFPETTSGSIALNHKRTTSKTKNTFGERDAPPEETHGDFGSAARFFASFPQGDVKRIFYTSKADSDDRLASKHPTVKPLALLQYLVRLITPKGGTCLDLFAGTGTTAEACFREGFRCILIEREDEYIADIERRMLLVMEGPDTRAYASMKARNRPRDDGPLFGGSNSDPISNGRQIYGVFADELVEGRPRRDTLVQDKPEAAE